MAAKTEHDLIEELLRKDEEELRAKKKRLRDFSVALDALRGATDTAREAAVAALEAGDLTRGELASAFSLSRGSERSFYRRKVGQRRRARRSSTDRPMKRATDPKATPAT